ncbi:glutathione S-transferase [Endogone sp. FLAS-F59071]|nr:glutathione S-transferase [Endogone sp. FLAS-F59071]|eukprot:RUS14735.1 glutathione S-transferase [Endogone sp. FLAS-F59071]
MTTTEPIKLYTALVCPYAQRANIALKEAGVEYESIEIDLQNKPSWYTDVNPESKVPAITVRGKNIAESLVIIELVADLYPEAKYMSFRLLPKDPVKRAQVRFFIEYYSSKIGSLQLKVLASLNDKEALNGIFAQFRDGLKRANQLLLEQSPTGPYFLGDQFSLADVAIAPFIARFQVFRDNYLEDFVIPEEYDRLLSWGKALQERESFKETWPGSEFILQAYAKRINK